MSVANELQHSQAWWLARRGKITASRMHTVMDGGVKAWQTLANTLMAERLMDDMPEPEDNQWKGAAIAHGVEYEPIARTNAELMMNADFDLVGFVQHPGFDFIGASPDALYCSFPVEIKCPQKLEKHMAVYRDQRLPDEHTAQVQTQIACTGAPMGYFISHHPTPPHWKMRTVILEVPRDQGYIDVMMERCRRFKSHVLDREPLVRPISTVKSYF
jgi:putative phage-type endonuclease